MVAGSYICAPGSASLISVSLTISEMIYSATLAWLLPFADGLEPLAAFAVENLILSLLLKTLVKLVPTPLMVRLSINSTALLVKSDSTTTPDAPIMAQLGTFSTRVSEERKHMETLVITCLTKASTNFLNTKMEATDQNNVEVGKAQALQTAADQELVNALATLIQKNNESVKKLLQTLEELLIKKEASVAQSKSFFFCQLFDS